MNLKQLIGKNSGVIGRPVNKQTTDMAKKIKKPKPSNQDLDTDKIAEVVAQKILAKLSGVSIDKSRSQTPDYHQPIAEIDESIVVTNLSLEGIESEAEIGKEEVSEDSQLGSSKSKLAALKKK